MIFYCPNCEKKYKVADKVIGDAGKTVKCVACAHEWLQKPGIVELDFVDSPEIEEENVSNDGAKDDIGLALNDTEYDANFFDPEFAKNDDDQENDDETDETADKIRALIEGENIASDEPSDDTDDEDSDYLDKPMPIPKGVTPVAELDSLKEGKKSKPKAKLKPKHEPKQKVSKEARSVPMLTKINSIVAAMLFFLLLFIILIFFRSDIVKIWPASAAIFDKAGFSVPMKGEGLVIEGFTAKNLESKNGQSKLVLQGRIVNLTEEPVMIPDLIVYFDDERIVSADSTWIIEPPVKELTAGESFNFTSDYENPKKNLKSIILTFRQEFL